MDAAQTPATFTALANALRQRGCPEAITAKVADRLREGAEPSWSAHDLDFAGVRFSGLANLERVRCHGKVDFTGATFAGRTIFVDSFFAGPVSLREVTFEGPAVLIGAQFLAGVDLRDATFRGPRIGPWGKGRPPRVWVTRTDDVTTLEEIP